MKRALILDLETTGTDPTKDKIVEIGMVLYSLEHHTILRCMSALVNSGVGNAAEAVNGIPAAALIGGITVQNAFGHLDAWTKSADVALAHNAAFDCSFLEVNQQARLPWVCTMDDIRWPRPCSSKGLTAIALAHGLGISHAHRALTDCLTIARLLERAHELGTDVQAMIARGMRPKARFVVAASGFDEARNALAKEHGFRWVKPNWVRTMAIDDAADLPFTVRQEVA